MSKTETKRELKEKHLPVTLTKLEKQIALNTSDGGWIYSKKVIRSLPPFRNIRKAWNEAISSGNLMTNGLFALLYYKQAFVLNLVNSPLQCRNYWGMRVAPECKLLKKQSSSQIKIRS